MLVSPILCQAAGAGGGKDGLTKVFKNFGDFGETFAGCVYLFEQRFYFGDDAGLFGEWRQW